MAKARTTAFFCKECGYESAKWMGQCPACRAWNSMVEEPVAKKETGRRGVSGTGTGSGRTVQKPVRLEEISVGEQDRIPTGYRELDRVLGSGIVAGSLVLVGGDPGIGKSTLLLQVCRNLAADGHRVLYISGEESLKQIKLRANRIGTVTGELLFLCETNLDEITEVIRASKPGAGIHQYPHADRQGPGNHCLYRGSCDQGRRGGGSPGAGAHGGHGALFRGGAERLLPDPPGGQKPFRLHQ